MSAAVAARISMTSGLSAQTGSPSTAAASQANASKPRSSPGPATSDSPIGAPLTDPAGNVTSGSPQKPAIAVTPMVAWRTASCSSVLAVSSGAGQGLVG